MLRFPLTFTFKIIAIAPQLTVVDASGEEVCYIRQKAFKLRESVTVFRNSAQQDVIGKIEADRIIDWGARYTFHDAEGHAIGAVGRRGAKSLFRAHYEIFADAVSKEVGKTIEEESVAIRLLDHLFGQIPLVGMFTGFVFHPSYAVKAKDGTVVARLEKQSAFLEGRFLLEKVADLSEQEEFQILLSCLMLTLLERSRS
jgi:hypothetical protein